MYVSTLRKLICTGTFFIWACFHEYSFIDLFYCISAIWNFLSVLYFYYYLCVFYMFSNFRYHILLILITGCVGRGKLTCCSFQHSRRDPPRWRYSQRRRPNYSHGSSLSVRLCHYGFSTFNGTSVFMWNPGMSLSTMSTLHVRINEGEIILLMDWKKSIIFIISCLNKSFACRFMKIIKVQDIYTQYFFRLLHIKPGLLKFFLRKWRVITDYPILLKWNLILFPINFLLSQRKWFNSCYLF